MAASHPSPRRRGPPAVAWILLLAVLVGVAAALLSRPVASVGSSTPSLGALTFNQLGQLVTIGLLIVVGLWLFVTLRDAGNRAPVPGRVVATILVILLLGVLFVEFAGLVHVAPIPSPQNSTAGSNSTGGGFSTNNTGNGTTSLFGTPSLGLPAWLGFVAVLIVAILAGVLLVPFAIARAEARRRGQGDGSTREAQNAFEETLHRLNSADPADARAAIVALYARLLLLVGPRLGTVTSRTPGEIQRDSIESLGLRPGVARDLTETFEEARYSTHPMTVDAVDRARTALTEAIADLARSAGVPS
ncbi:MAG: DUF4129 domain-containing protein [Thermoplasmata archaeon]